MPCQNLVLVVQLKRIGFDCFILTVFLYQMGILTGGLLICTLISESQCLEKSRSVSNLRKISGPANLDFFSVCHLDFFRFIVQI